VDIDQFLLEVSKRTHGTLPSGVDPIAAILTRVRVDPDTAESRALRKATLAVIATKGEMSKFDLWALGQDALALLDAFVNSIHSARYPRSELDIFATRLSADEWREGLGMGQKPNATAPMFDCSTCCRSYTAKPSETDQRIVCPHCGTHYQEAPGKSESGPVGTGGSGDK